MTLTAATCFSGIGAPEVAIPGWDWKFHAEIEKFPSAVMTARHPESVNLGDVLAPDFIERAKALGPIDVMAGGPPCQGFSVAGLRGGMSDPRGNLTLRWVQILHAIQPRNAVTENVPGWLSMPDNAFGCFLAGLVGADDALHSPLEEGKWPGQGMASGPRARCAWRILDAQYFGVAQRRRRVFVVADFGNGADPAQVLFERQGMLGNSPPSREKGKGITHDVAPSLTASGRGVERSGETRGQDPVVSCAELEMQSVRGGMERQVCRYSGQPGCNGPSGMCEMRDGGRCGLDRDVTTVCARMAAFGEYVDDGTASTIKQRDYKDATDLIGYVSFKHSGKDYKARPLAAGAHAPAIAQEWAVRRLSPVECARLQGFPDDYLDIAFRGKPAADGNKYKALGNSWAVPCGQWILKRIERFMP
jgi:DNA (cytosine-5)-methyltransferase 1